MWTATARGGTFRLHASNIVPARLVETVWCTKFQSSLLHLLPSQCVPVFAPTYSLPRRTELVFTLHQSGAQNLSHMWRSTFEIGVAQSRSVTEIERRSVTSRYLGSTISGLQQDQRRHFFAVVAPVRHETSLFHEPALWSKWTQHQTWNWIRSVKFEIVRMDF